VQIHKKLKDKLSYNYNAYGQFSIVLTVLDLTTATDEHIYE